MTLFRAICYTINSAVLCSVAFALIGIAFQSTLRFSKQKTIIIMSIGYCIGLIIDLLILEKEATFHAYFIVGIVIMALLDLIFALIVFKKDPLQLLLGIFMVITVYDSLQAVATQFDSLNLLPVFATDFPSLNHTIYFLVAFFITLPFLSYLFCRLLRQMVEIGIDMHLWRALFLLPLFNYITGIIGDMHWTAYQLGTIPGLISALVRYTLTIGGYIIALKMLLYAYEKAVSVYRIEVAEQQVELEREWYKTLSEHIAETSRLHHDWRHHMLAFRALIDEGDLQGLSDYLCQIGGTYRVDRSPTICERLAVDVILRHYLGQAMEQGIEVQHRVNIPATFGRADLDMCIVFGNLIENALEACLRQKDGLRFISVTAESINESTLAIQVKNSFSGTVMEKNGNYLSSKRKGNGLGLSSVKNIVVQNNGMFRISSADNVFTVEILLKS